jgi:hypothetical protein
MNGNNARQILEQPFDQGLIKTRQASYGGLSYVEGHEYIKRLNQAFDGQWSFEIVKHEIGENEVFVIGKLVADGVVKMAFGGSDIKRKKESGEIISISDDLKAAATDALKKAASLLGLGLHLYGDTAGSNGKPTNGNGDAKPANAAKPASAAPANGNGNGNGSAQPSGGNGEDKGRLSSKQLGMILALARERSLSRDKLQNMVTERYGRTLEFLTRSEASFFIGELQQAA